MYYSHLIGHHSCQDCLLLCRRQVFQFGLYWISVLVIVFHSLDICGVDVRQSQSRLLMEVQNMIVEPLSLYEEHVKFLMLAFIQSVLYNLEFIYLDNLVLPPNPCLVSGIANLVPFFFRTDQSIVNILHHILFTQIHTKTHYNSLRNLKKLYTIDGDSYVILKISHLFRHVQWYN